MDLGGSRLADEELNDPSTMQVESSEVDELESVLESTKLMVTSAESDASENLLHEVGTEFVEENQEPAIEFPELSNAGNGTSKIVHLSLDEARVKIPESVLNTLKTQFNGSLELCRPINQSDRIF